MSIPSNLVKASSTYNELNDCAIKAVAIVSGKTYNVVHKLFKDNGRRNRGSTSIKTINIVLKALGKNAEITRQFKAKTITTLSKELPSRGVFLVYVKGHVLACRGGIVQDWTNGRRYRIKRVLRIKSV